MSSALKKSPSVLEVTPPQAALAENRRILVVEDEVEIANSYVDLLADKSTAQPARKSSRVVALKPQQSSASNGFEVTVVHDAQSALETVEKSIKEGRPFAMAFVDVLLGPGQNGIELVQKVFQIDHELRVVFVTAYQDRSVDSIEALLGTDNMTRWDYLNKPFSEGEILQKARNGVAYWNLQRQAQQRELELEEARHQLLSSERHSTLATVARGVGHEFGNILLHIMGRAELSRMGDQAEMERGLDVILKACETATEILERFNNLAKPSQATVEKKEIFIREPLDEALQLTQYQLKSVRVHVDEKDKGLKAYASKNSLVQVFVNLFMNAKDAMEDDGAIHITLQSHDKDWVEVTVRDEGPGIPQELLERVTEAFFTTKPEGKGTGLGLAICREILEIEHQGEFIVQNHKDRGAEFVLRLPVHNVERKGDEK
jgi:two-component system NtrC family sensor kinase